MSLWLVYEKMVICDRISDYKVTEHFCDIKHIN